MIRIKSNVLRSMMWERNIRICDLAHRSKINAPAMSSIAGGWLHIGEKRKTHLEQALLEFGFSPSEIDNIFEQI